MATDHLQLPIEIRRLQAMLLIREFEERVYQEFMIRRGISISP